MGWREKGTAADAPLSLSRIVRLRSFVRTASKKLRSQPSSTAAATVLALPELLELIFESLSISIEKLPPYRRKLKVLHPEPAYIRHSFRPSSLSSCALVSRAWLAEVRRVRDAHRRICVPDYTNKTHGRGAPRTLCLWTRTDCSQHPSFPLCAETSPGTALSELRDSLPGLGNVRALELTRITFDVLMCKELARMRAVEAFSAVDCGVDVDAEDQLLAAVAAWPRLRSLALGVPPRRWINEHLRAPAAPSPKLHTLELQHLNVDLDWMLAGSAETLRRLGLLSFRVSTHAVDDLIRTISPVARRVRYLILGTQAPVALVQFAAAAMPRLEYACLVVRAPTLDFFRTFASRSLERLAIAADLTPELLSAAAGLRGFCPGLRELRVVVEKERWAPLPRRSTLRHLQKVWLERGVELDVSLGHPLRQLIWPG